MDPRIEWRPSQLRVASVGPLAARVAGRGGVPVVLLHGLAASGELWGSAWEELATTGMLLIPDLLGFGRSPKPSTSYGLDVHAGAVINCMAAAEIDQPALLVGHSFGALVALTLARQESGHVSGLVLLSPPLHRDAGEARRRTVAALSPLERRVVMDTALAEWLCRSLCTRRPRLAAQLAVRWRPELPATIARGGTLHTWQSYSGSLAELLGARARPEWVHELRIPVRVLFGDGDRCLDRELLMDLGDTGRSVVVEVIAGTDHLLPLQAPQACMSRVEMVRAACASPVEQGATVRTPGRSNALPSQSRSWRS